MPNNIITVATCDRCSNPAEGVDTWGRGNLCSTHLDADYAEFAHDLGVY